MGEDDGCLSDVQCLPGCLVGNVAQVDENAEAVHLLDELFAERSGVSETCRLEQGDSRKTVPVSAGSLLVSTRVGEGVVACVSESEVSNTDLVEDAKDYRQSLRARGEKGWRSPLRELPRE